MDNEFLFSIDVENSLSPEEDFATSLRNFMDEEERKILEVTEDSAAIMTKEQANYFTKKLLECRAYMDEVNAFADKEIERTTKIVNEWREKRLDVYKKQEEYLLSILKEFAEKELPPDAKTKSIKLPNGTLGFRKQQPKYEYEEDTLLLFLESNEKLKSQFVKYKPFVNKTELKKMTSIIDGSLVYNNIKIDGVTVVPQEDKFDVK